MRKVTFGGANSLDNYLARKDDAVDWLLWGKEAESYTTAFWKTIDTVLMGRKTYEAAMRNSKGSANPSSGFARLGNSAFSRNEPPDRFGAVVV